MVHVSKTNIIITSTISLTLKYLKCIQRGYIDAIFCKFGISNDFFVNIEYLKIKINVSNVKARHLIRLLKRIIVSETFN